MLKLLPPTEDAYILHLQRAALATIIDKTAPVVKPQLPPFVDYGWALEDGETSSSPVDSTSLATDNYTSRCMWLHQRMQQKLFLCKEERGLLHWMSLPGIRHQV